MDKMYTLLYFTQKAISELCMIILPFGATANVSGLPVQPVDILITMQAFTPTLALPSAAVTGPVKSFSSSVMNCY